MKFSKEERFKMKLELMKILSRNQVGIPSEVIAEGEESIQRWIEHAVDEHIARFERARKSEHHNSSEVKLDIPSFLRERKRNKRR